MNASTCSITTEELRAFPELHGSTQTTLDTPYFYIPDKVSTVVEHEIPLLEQIAPREIQQIDEVRSRVITPSQTFDVDSLFHLRQVSLHQEQRTFWHLIVTTTVCALAILGILCFSFTFPCTLLYTLLSLHKRHYRTQYCYFKNPSPEIPEPSQRTHLPRSDELPQDVNIYGLSTETSRIIIIKNTSQNGCQRILGE